MDVKRTQARASELFQFVRMSQFPFLVRRMLGMATVDRRCFLTDARPDILSSIALAIRGADYHPALFVHGVLPRSGTNFLADAIAIHPHTVQNPGALWEFPLLYVASGADALQREFTFMFPPNGKVMKQYEMLAYLASGWMKVLQAQSKQHHMLFKSPHMQYVALFPALFPRDRMLILLRDGRDVLHSSLATFGHRWSGKSFAAMAAEWAAAVELALSFSTGGALACDQARVVRYEDLVHQGRPAMEQVLAHCGLDGSLYDWASFENLPLRGSSTNKAVLEQKWQQEKRPETFNPVGRWHDWPQARKECFKKHAGQMLIAAGYADDLAW